MRVHVDKARCDGKTSCVHDANAISSRGDPECTDGGDAISRQRYIGAKLRRSRAIVHHRIAQ